MSRRTATDAARELNASDPVGALYGVADDHEAGILDALRERAGLTWEHEGCWTNEGHETHCERCGESRRTAAR